MKKQTDIVNHAIVIGTTTVSKYKPGKAKLLEKKCGSPIRKVRRIIAFTRIHYL